MLEIGRASVVFEPDCGSNGALSSTNNRNFFDKSSSRICTMRNNGALSFTCKSLDQNTISTRTRDRGPATGVKISPNGKLAAVQRQNSSVDVVLMEKNDSSGVAIEFNVASKSREPIMLVEWVTNNQMLFVTSQCMELMSVFEDKRSSKLIRSTNISASWAVYYAPSNLVILATGASSSVLQPVLIHHGQFTRLKPFELKGMSLSAREHVLEKDVFAASIYGNIYAMVIRYKARNSSTAEVLMYELSSDPNIPAKLSYILSIGFSDGFGIHVIDNLVLVHHQASSKSLVYDIALALDTGYHSPLFTTTIFAHQSCQPPPNLYNHFWHIFLPDVVADPVVGMMYNLTLRCEMADMEIKDTGTLIHFLINRSGYEIILIGTLQHSLRMKKLTLKQLKKIFGLLAANLVTPVIRLSETTKSQLLPYIVDVIKLDQKMMLSGVFIPLKEDDFVERKYLANVMLHYLQSLHSHSIKADAYFMELLVEVLAEAGQIYKLKQLVAYRVIDETKQLAYMLVSYAARCPHISQSAVDILSRQKANDEILEILLENGFVIDAARFMDTFNASDTHVAKLTEAAAGKDRQTVFAVQNYLARRNKSGSGRWFDLFKNWKPFTDANKTATLFSAEELDEAQKDVALCRRLD